MDCATCHTDGAFIGKPDQKRPLAGSSIAHAIPGAGIFWPPNLTPDQQTGIGSWSESDIVKAIRTGERPDGRILVPAMPWRAYASLTDDDARAVARYLKSLPPTVSTLRPPAGEHEHPDTPVVSIAMPGMK
jgi:mono/diheme cytochrome c family protein